MVCKPMVSSQQSQNVTELDSAIIYLPFTIYHYRYRSRYPGGTGLYNAQPGKQHCKAISF